MAHSERLYDENITLAADSAESSIKDKSSDVRISLRAFSYGKRQKNKLLKARPPSKLLTGTRFRIDSHKEQTAEKYTISDGNNSESKKSAIERKIPAKGPESEMSSSFLYPTSFESLISAPKGRRKKRSTDAPAAYIAAICPNS